MTLRTITYDDAEWQVVPREPNEAMVRAGLAASFTANKYLAMLAAAPEPPAQQINQCDGCRRGLPVNERGIHRGEGYDLIACTAHLYQAPAQEPMTDAQAAAIEALQAVLATLEWHAHGGCRATAGPIMPSADAVAMGKAALAALNGDDHA